MREFRIAVPEAELYELRQRLATTRWPDRETVGGWTQGVPLEYAQELCAYWRERYDWRRCEAELNSWPQFRTGLDGGDRSAQRIERLRVGNLHHRAIRP